MQAQFSLDEIREVAKRILKQSTSKTLCFYAEMGAGKTTLIKALVQELDGSDIASSPTFGIVNQYHKEDGELLAYHFDFYRLEDETEALDLGFEDYLIQETWIFIEWPEKVQNLLPKETTNIFIELVDDKTRKLRID